jgi:hypothetical protein
MIFLKVQWCAAKDREENFNAKCCNFDRRSSVFAFLREARVHCIQPEVEAESESKSSKDRRHLYRYKQICEKSFKFIFIH